MANETFSVDTHLFRELGELLVGRDSTALIELIKNAYDADAEEVTVDGQQLDSPRHGVIKIVDDGVGMTYRHFKDGFLRIASRFKDEGDRHSVRYKRRFTGAKGIGRLAAHKLASQLTITSIPGPEILKEDDKGVTATIDWDKVEAHTTLNEVAKSDAVTVSEDSVSAKAKSGTTIELRHLRRKWSPTERAVFFAEVGAYNPPTVLVNPPAKQLRHPLLFEKPQIADTKPSDPGFSVKLTGEFESGDEYWPALLQAAQWMIEIDANETVRFRVAPTKTGKDEFPEAKRFDAQIEHPNKKAGPFFQARILIREGVLSGSRAERAWLGRSSGIRVYMEGFRVLPYGEESDDWLSLDADYKKRQKTLGYLEEVGFDGEAVDENEGLQFLGNSAYFGAVFLTLNKAPTLKMLINREGFVPSPEFSALVQILRTGVYVSARVRAAAKQELREARSAIRKASQSDDHVAKSRVELKQVVQASVTEASELANQARRFAAVGDIENAKKLIDRAGQMFALGGETSQRLMTEGAMLRVLASVGTQMAAFVHEINSLLGAAISLEQAIGRLREDNTFPASARKKLAEFHSAIGDLRRSVERQALYLTDVISPDARRRRSRQKLSERFDAACRFVQSAAEKRGIRIENLISSEIKSPPLFPAEVTLVFSNLLTNAVKAAGNGGIIRATGHDDEDGPVLRIENTGVEVELAEAERWFRPFESTTMETDPVLGQGMGMGLAITRNILEEYGAQIYFTKPSKGFSTAIQIKFKE
jgi:signal transduction histidine kinase